MHDPDSGYKRSCRIDSATAEIHIQNMMLPGKCCYPCISLWVLRLLQRIRRMFRARSR